MIPVAAALVVLAQVGPPPPAEWSQATAFEGVFRNWLDDENTANRQEDFLDGMSRIYVLATRPGVEVGLQLDGAAAWPNDRAGLINVLTPPPGWSTGLLFSSRESARVMMEKKFLRWQNGDGLSLEIGDAYRALGRGLALSLVKNSELSIDTSIEGASLDATWNEFEIGGWAGQSNPQTVSTLFVNRLRPDPRDTIGGARVKLASGPVELFAHANGLDIDERVVSRVFLGPDLVEVRTATAGGGGISLPDLAGGDLYLEGTWVRYRVSDDTGVRDAAGRGFYGAASFFPGRFTIVLEGKHYENLEVMNVRQAEGTATPYDYSTPPTLEKENLVNPNRAETVNSNGVSGARAGLSARVGKGLVRTTVAAFRDLGHERDLYNGNEDIVHGYGGYERRGGGTFWQITAGYRYETRREAREVHDRQVHVDADALFAVGAIQFEMKALAYRQWETEPISGEALDYDSGSVVASVRPFRWLAIATLIDYTTDEAMLSGLLRREGNLDRNTFAGLEVAVMPTERSTARVFAGAAQGGLKCSGGTCRIVPAFEGVRVEWQARF